MIDVEQLNKEIKNKIEIAENCIKALEKSRLTVRSKPELDNIILQLQFHRGYVMAMNETLGDIEYYDDEE